MKTVIMIGMLLTASLVFAIAPTASAVPTCVRNSAAGVGICSGCWGVHVSSCVGWNGGYGWCGDDGGEYLTCFVIENTQMLQMQA